MSQILDTNSSENKFVSLKEAMAASGYAKDYIGQLCRSQKIESRLNNGSWVVNLVSLLQYKEKTALVRREKMRKEVWTNAESKENKIPQFLAKNRTDTDPSRLDETDPWDQALLGEDFRKPGSGEKEPITIPLRIRISSFSRLSLKPLVFAIILVLSGFWVWQHPEFPSRVYTNLEHASKKAVIISGALLHQTLLEVQVVDIKVVFTPIQQFLEMGPLFVGKQVGSWFSEKGGKATEALFTLITKTQEQVRKSIFSSFSKTFRSEEEKEDVGVLPPGEESPEIVVKEDLPSETLVKEEVESLRSQGLEPSPIPPVPTLVERVIIERTIERIISGLSQQELDLAIQALNNKFLNEIAQLKDLVSQRANANFQAIALTNKIDSLSNVTLTSATVSGVSGLTDADIPDDITLNSGSNAVFTGNLTVDTNTLFVDAATNRVGIGTMSPVSPLTVRSSVAGVDTIASFVADDDGNVMTLLKDISDDAVLRLFDGAGNIVIEFNADSTFSSFLNAGSLGIGTTTPFGLLSVEHTTGNVGFVVGSSSATSFIVDASGNVGIGTTSPADKLDVAGSIRISQDTGTHYTFNVDSNGQFFIHNESANLFPFKIEADANSNSLVLDAGNVGIGTTTPTTKFSVGGNAGDTTGHGYFTGGVGIGILNTTAGTLVTLGSITISNLTNCNASSVLETDGSGVIQCGADAGSGGLGTAGGWTSNDSDQTVTLATSTYSIGIGTTSPYAKLSINSLDAATTTFALRPFTSQTANIIDIYDTSGALTSVFTQDHKFGIGTANPVGAVASQQTLQLNDNVIIQSVVTGQAMFSDNAYFDSDSVWKYATTDQARAMRMGHIDGISFHIAPSGTAGETITNWDGGDVKMVLLESGNVGIGTTSPVSLLTVSNSSGNSFIVIDSKNTNTPFIRFDRGSVSKWEIGPNVGGAIGDTFGIYDNAATTVRLVINTSGNVGIGTTNVDERLHVANSSGAVSIKVENEDIASPGDPTLMFTLAGTDKFTIGVDDSDLDKFKISDGGSLGTNDRLTIDSSGNVGIGTTSPDTLFHIEGTGTVRARIQSSSVDGIASIEVKNDTISWALHVDGTDSDSFQIRDDTNGVEMLTITTSGNIGIGTTSPESLFAIEANRPILTIGTSDIVNDRPAVLALRSSGTGGVSESTDNFTKIQFSGNLTSNNPSLFIGTPSTNHLTITNAGNVGIGTTSPTTLFSVTGGDGVYITSSGNVGIGIANPRAKLDVRDQAVFGLNISTVDSKGGIYVSSGTGVGGARQYWIGASNPASHNNNNFVISDVPSIGSDTGATNLLTILGAHNGANAGNVGIGDTSPDTILHIKNSGSPVLRVETTNASNVSRLEMKNGNGTLGGLTMTTNGHTQIFANNDVKMTIEAGGDIGINDTTPSFRLEVLDDGATVAVVRLENTNTGSGADVMYMQLGVTTAGDGNTFIQFDDGGGKIGSIVGNSGTGGVAYNDTSDIRIKKDIITLTEPLDTVMGLRAIEFTPIERTASSQTGIGFIAQEVYEVEPRLVTAFPDDSDELWMIDYGKFTPVLVGAVQEQQLEIQGLEARVWDLESRDWGLGAGTSNIQTLLSQTSNWSITDDGTLVVKKLVAEEVCLGQTCINEGQLKTLLNDAGILQQISNPEVEDTIDSTIVITTPATTTIAIASSTLDGATIDTPIPETATTTPTQEPTVDASVDSTVEASLEPAAEPSVEPTPQSTKAQLESETASPPLQVSSTPFTI